MSKNTFSNEAQKYWDKNLTVVPIKPGTKQSIPKWSDFVDQIPSQKNQKDWLNTYGDYGIALLTGKKVLDDKIIIGLDVDNDRYTDAIIRIFGSACGKKGQKGITLFALAEPDLKHTTIDLKKRSEESKTDDSNPRIIDVLVRKCCILPPTLHKNTGKPYEWVGIPLPECDLSDLPVVTKQNIALLKAIIQNPNHEFILSGQATHDAVVSLTASLAARFDESMIIRFLSAFLPKNYQGNLLSELPEMIQSAKSKGLGKQGELEYNPEKTGPIPLGYTDNGNYVFIHQEKNILSIAAPGTLMSVPGLCDLAPMDFWYGVCPKYSKEGLPTAQIDEKRIGNLLMQECRKSGGFTPSRVRGCGVWREDDTIIQNLRGPLPESETFTYIRFSPLPAFKTDQLVDPQKLLEWFELFNWREPGFAKLLLGWMALAPIGGALAWRTHIFINGPKNTGKTTLIRGLTSLLYPMAVILDGSTTEAGIRQSIGADSRPVILDEFESDHNTHRMRSVLKLARSASSGAAPIARGTPEGRAIQFQVHSPFCFGAIIPIPGTAADASRIVELELAKHDSDRSIKSAIDDGLSYLSDRKSVWCHQMIELIKPLIECIKIFETAMPAGESRHSINMANLLGAAFVVLNNRTATKKEAEKWVKLHSTMLKNLALAHEEDDSADCLNHLLQSTLRIQEIGETTIGQLLNECAATAHLQGNDDTETLLTRHGIKPMKNGFLVANKHKELNRIFNGTLWENGAWKAALRRIQGAKADDKTRARFSGGGVVRCVLVPYKI